MNIKNIKENKRIQKELKEFRNYLEKERGATKGTPYYKKKNKIITLS